MIAAAAPLRVMVRLTAPLAFRSELRVARKLEGFAAAEAGSALDMLKAAELTDEGWMPSLEMSVVLQVFCCRARISA